MDFAVWMYLLYEILVKFVMLRINIVFFLFFWKLYIFFAITKRVFIYSRVFPINVDIR